MPSSVPTYRVQDRSILLPVYRRFFVDPLLPLLPASLHPNTITHAGHLANLTGAVLLVALRPARGWPFAAALALVQIYLWCDNADGAHARRTRQSSAMGELLDHGFDQLHTVYIGGLTAMALGLSPSASVFMVLIIPLACAFTYWEQAATGTLHLGLLNQVESLTVLSGALALSALLGTAFWSEARFFGVSLQHACLVWVGTTFLFGMLRNAQRVGGIAGWRALVMVLPLLAIDATILAAAVLDAISPWVAITLASWASVRFGMRMLTVRLLHLPREPRVDPALTAAIPVVAVFIAFRLVTGRALGAPAGPALAALGSAVFGVLTLADARRSVRYLQNLPAPAARPLRIN